ncbi:protease modulator HflK [Tautonia sociabilis]|uniref:Protease modulator HflK n=1 Tax=Tautonia sociabilis TaxID=2080755 RepID=A0A432MK40_9BACT|nr:protease modulator HflK [Tautonia sociabilis]RUL87609.1 protease modulator HflK [Tautonia sociabilis]
MRRFVLVVVLLVSGWAVLSSAGLVAVKPGEVAVVRRLGRFEGRPRGPGLHWVLPVGIDRVDRVRTDEVRRLVVGLSGVPGPEDAPGEGEFLSGDLNLIRAEAVVQYRASDPVAFSLAGDRVEPLLAGLGESALASALARRGIDEAMLDGRSAVADEVQRELSESVDRLGLGVAILGVSLTGAQPPEEVRPDFAATQAARSEAEARIREAQGHADRVLGTVSSESAAVLDRAHAAADRSVALARARADRFRSLAAELGDSRSLTVLRLYQEALTSSLPRVGRTIVLEPDEPLDLSLLGASGPAEAPRNPPPTEGPASP